MGEGWFEALRHPCQEATAAAGSPYGTDVLLFYLARWCQKTTGKDRPRLSEIPAEEIGRAAARIARNLAEDGSTVESLVAGDDAEAWTSLRRILAASARPRDGSRAAEYADEALQRIALVLLTGTPPSRAPEQLQLGPEGPRNEYVFHSPFPYWARSIVINLVIDDRRREARQRRRRPERAPTRVEPLDPPTLAGAGNSLPGLVEAVRALPPVQRSVLALSLCRKDVDELVRERLDELAPDLFTATADPPASDRDIAQRLGTTRHLVAANRSAARRKLAGRDARWELLLDALLPHRSTRPIATRSGGTRSEAGTGSEAADG